MSRYAQVLTVRSLPPTGPGAACMPPSAAATVTLAWAQCCCGEQVETTVRPTETTGDVMDAALHAAGWDAAHDLCPDCIKWGRR